MSISTLSIADQRVLWGAACKLERESLVARLSELTGEPITLLLRSMPPQVSQNLNRVVQSALWQALQLAVYKMDSGLPEPGALGFKIMSGITGGVSGFFGAATLAVELPVTTTLMLRSIAGIARKEGEDLEEPGARLACLEVFALASRRDNLDDSQSAGEASYYAIRAFLAKTVSEAAQLFTERGLVQRSSPIIGRLLAAIGSRFGLVVSEKVAAGAIPVVGAIGGAAVNLAFMEHFQGLAKAHFAIRRLERQHGPEEVHRIYEGYAALVRERAAK